MDYVATEEAKRVLYRPTAIGIDEVHLNKPSNLNNGGFKIYG